MAHEKDCPCMYCSGRRLGKLIEKEQKAKRARRLIVEASDAERSRREAQP